MGCFGSSFFSLQETSCKSVFPWFASPVKGVFLRIEVAFSYTALQFILL